MKPGKKPAKAAPRKPLNDRMEALLKEFLAKVAEASYQVALKTGFRGSFMTFLSDLQDALDQVVHKDRALARRLGRAAAAGHRVVH
ncbi:MAG TPA: hypothetical protein VFX30_11775 [bacterium]|nr:hypothetical protein [bacterium]